MPILGANLLNFQVANEGDPRSIVPRGEFSYRRSRLHSSKLGAKNEDRSSFRGNELARCGLKRGQELSEKSIRRLPAQPQRFTVIFTPIGNNRQAWGFASRFKTKTRARSRCLRATSDSCFAVKRLQGWTRGEQLLAFHFASLYAS